MSEGRTAEIFAYDQNKVLKLYRNGLPNEAVNHEYAVNQLVAALGIPAPRAYELVDCDNRKGIVFERINGSTLLNASVQYPTELNRLIEQFTDLHYRIHQHEPDTRMLNEAPIVKQKKVLAQNIKNGSQLPDDVKSRIIACMEHLPDGNCLCHGDFHPDNVMIGARSWVIDWMTGMIGNPAADVARTMLIFRFGTLPDEAPSHIIEALDRMRGAMNEIYAERYMACSGLPYRDIDEWMLPVAAARLSEWIPEAEKAKLVSLIEERLK